MARHEDKDITQSAILCDSWSSQTTAEPEVNSGIIFYYLNYCIFRRRRRSGGEKATSFIALPAKASGPNNKAPRLETPKGSPAGIPYTVSPISRNVRLAFYRRPSRVSDCLSDLFYCYTDRMRTGL